MEKFEVTLEVNVNGSRRYVSTIVVAFNAIQARDLALAMAGVGGSIVFGPYPVT
jgi:hypothetical protein